MFIKLSAPHETTGCHSCHDVDRRVRVGARAASSDWQLQRLYNLPANKSNRQTVNSVITSPHAHLFIVSKTIPYMRQVARFTDVWKKKRGRKRKKINSQKGDKVSMSRKTRVVMVRG